MNHSQARLLGSTIAMVGGAIVANATLNLGVAIVLISGAMFVGEYVRSYRA